MHVVVTKVIIAFLHSMATNCTGIVLDLVKLEMHILKSDKDFYYTANFSFGHFVL